MEIEYISQDITFCLAQCCKKLHNCHRAIGAKPGIHSYANFEDECRNNNYINYIQARKEDTERYISGEVLKKC